MTQVLKHMSNAEAAEHLRIERLALNQERIEKVQQIRQLQSDIDVIDQRLHQIEEGERVLSQHGYR